IPASLVLRPVIQGYEDWDAPVYAFLIEHEKGKVLFDLGARKDREGLAPAVREALDTTFLGQSVTVVLEDVPEQLVKNGISLNDIQAVIWSHNHFDHIGDMSKFPSTTELVVGAGTNLKTYPTFKDAPLMESDTSGRKINIISFDNTDLRIEDLRAMDYFGDGSLYLLDTPGHQPGHISSLARVTPTTFVFLGGDCCHHPGVLRPTPLHHARFPCPGHIMNSMARSQDFRAFGATPMLTVPSDYSSIYVNGIEAADTLAKIARLDAHPDVLTLLAHDASAPGVVELFPRRVEEWKGKGLKERLMW
ncbi:Metallo-hydrolase/oxidoreductase, partial [Hymenopellis radicata]